jgi:hypothetical protein
VWAVDWINLAQYNVQWWDLVNTIIYLHVPQRDGSFVPTEQPLTFGEELFSIELKYFCVQYHVDKYLTSKHLNKRHLPAHFVIN